MPVKSINSAGFSLLELLLVLVIVGLIATIAGLSVSSGSRPYTIEGSVRIFADVAEYAMDEAQLMGVDMGLLLSQRRERTADVYSYQWLQRRPTGWEPLLEEDRIFDSRDFPAEIELQLAVEDDIAELEDAAAQQKSDLQPQVIFYSSGETTPGSLTLLDTENGDILWLLEWDLLGRITLKRRGLDDDES